MSDAESICAVCGRVGSRTRVRGLRATDTDGLFSIERCADCGVLRTTPVPSDLSPYYATDLAATMYDRGSRLFAALRAIQLRRELRRLKGLGTNGALLDLGCGVGDFSGIAGEAGYSVVAADAGEQPPPLLRTRPEIRYTPFDFESYELRSRHHAGPYVVVLRHVLEHVRDPWRLLRCLQRQGARAFYIVVPNVACAERRLLGRYWYLWDPPRHLWHFDRSTLAKLGQRAGLEIVSEGAGTAPTLLPDAYRLLRVHRSPAALYRHLGPNSLLTAITSPINLLVAGNVRWLVARARA